MKRSLMFVLLLLIVFIMAGAAVYRSLSNPENKDSVLSPGSRKLDSAADRVKASKKAFEALVVLDPGHGGNETGTVNYGMVEKEVNLDITLRLEKLLTASGVKTLLTRRDDSPVGLRKRAELANEADAALFISIHNNNIPNLPGFKGSETLYAYPDNPKASVIDGKRLAEIVQKKMVDKLGTRDNGLKLRPELAVLHRTDMPAVIAEIAYMSNKEERDNLAKPEFRDKAAEAIRDAVLEALKEDGAVKDRNGTWSYIK